jgi:acetolactate synthase-1/2/3 large subunit
MSDRQETVSICSDPGNVVEALESIAEASKSLRDVNPDGKARTVLQRPELPSGGLTVEKACLTVSALQPECAIVVDESITAGATYFSLSAGLPPHTLLCVSGGSIGFGIPCATGASIACPDRPVINLQADGSALYTVQALWTQAREGLNVTTLIFSNRSYRILEIELDRAGEKKFGPNTRGLIDLKNPDLNWVEIATGFGVPGSRVYTAEGLRNEFLKALSEPGPHLIEMVVP